MSESSSSCNSAATGNGHNGVEIGGHRRKMLEARRQFEESLQKLTRTDQSDVECPQLLRLLLTTPTRARAGGGEALAAASARAPADVVMQDGDVDAKKNAVTLTDEHEHPASVADDDRTSVFTSDDLDEYLAANRMEDTPFSTERSQMDDRGFEARGEKDLDRKWIGSTDAEAGKPQGVASMSVSGSSGKDESMMQQVGSTFRIKSEGSDGCASDIEVDVIDGFSFYSFSTRDALLQHSEQAARAGVDSRAPGVKKFQYGIAGKYLAKMNGWERRASTTTACDHQQRADAAVDALLDEGMVRQLSDTAVLGLNLSCAADPDDDAAVNGDGGWAGTGTARYPRRDIGVFGDEERQPRHGRIYGRKFDGRFASKANIHYHTKRRRSPTPAYPVSPSSDTGISKYSVRTREIISTLLSPNLQPRVCLTNAVIPLTTLAAKDSVQSFTRPKVCNKDKTVAVVKSSERIYLAKLTEASATRAIVALQLAPSMNNSPLKCHRPSTIYVFV